MPNNNNNNKNLKRKVKNLVRTLLLQKGGYEWEQSQRDVCNIKEQKQALTYNSHVE